MSSYELILEVPSEIVKVVAIDEKSNNLSLKSASMVLLKKSLSVVNSESGYVYRNYEAARNAKSETVDCIYIKSMRSFLVALADSSLILIPEAAKKATEYLHMIWPVVPSRLYCANHKDVIVYSHDGAMGQFSFSADGTFPSVTAAPKNSSTTTINVASSYNNHHITVVTAVKPELPVKKSKSIAAAKGPEQLTVISYKTAALLPGKMTWFGQNSNDISAIKGSVQLSGADELLMHLVAHKMHESVSFILHSVLTGATRWVKTAIDGSVLFERALTSQPVAVVEVGDQLWMTDARNSRVSCWDSRFGVEVKTFVTSTALAGNSFVIPYGYSGMRDCPAVLPCQLILCSASASGDATVIYRHTLTTESQPLRSSLCGAIGKLSNIGAAADVMAGSGAGPFNVSIYEDNNNNSSSSSGKTKDAAIVSDDIAASGRVLAGLPGPMKRKLKQVQQQYDAQVKLEAAEYAVDLSAAPLEDCSERCERRMKKFYLDVPDAIARAFLLRLESAAAADLAASDWDLVKVLLRSGTLSLAGNPSLLAQATAAHRFDVIAHIVRYVSDLTERQCVKVLHMCLFTPDATLERVHISNGQIQWGAKSASSVSLSGATEETKMKSSKKKDKKGSSSAVDSESAALEGAVGDHRVLIVRAMMESVMQRSAAFSTVLLSEAVRLLSPATCALLLRAFAFTLKGLTTQVNDTGINAVHLSRSVGDEQLRHAVTWMEALLDGHFSATALQASVHAPTRRALTSAMVSVSSAEAAAEELEAAMGLWTHITRVIHSGSEQTKPIPGLYQVEQLSF